MDDVDTDWDQLGKESVLNSPPDMRITEWNERYLGKSEAAASAPVVFVGAFKLQILPSNPP